MVEVTMPPTMGAAMGFTTSVMVARCITTETRLKELQLVRHREARIAQAEIPKHVQKITLTVESRTYIPSGTWNVPGPENDGCAGDRLYVTSSTVHPATNSRLAPERLDW
jgi:hypothetical protein